MRRLLAWLIVLAGLAGIGSAGLWTFGDRLGEPYASWRQSLIRETQVAHDTFVRKGSEEPFVSWRRMLASEVHDAYNAVLRLANIPSSERPAAPIVPAAFFADTPQLLIETGRHTGTLMAAALDANAKVLVTGGLDKTVRLWALPDDSHKDLQLMDTLRLPFARNGDYGQVYAVAISPKEGLIAAAGRTWDGDNRVAAYVFDRITGQISFKLEIPSRFAITQMAFSPDGTELAVGLGGPSALRVYRISDRKLIFPSQPQNADVGDHIEGLSFDRNHHLATCSFDGVVRLYDGQFNLLAHTKAPDGKQPSGIAFSPDGSLLALGYEDTAPTFTLLDGKTLAKRGGYSNPDADPGNTLDAFAWSPDGRYLYAAGDDRVFPGVAVIHRYDTVTRVESSFIGHSNGAKAIFPFGPSGVLVAGGDPWIGTYDAHGKLLFSLGPALHNMSTWGSRIASSQEFRTSNDGTIFDIPTNSGHQPALRVDLLAPRVERIGQPDPGLAPPILGAPEFELFRSDGDMFGWLSWSLKKRNEPAAHALGLAKGDAAGSWAIARSSKWFALGTRLGINLYANDGRFLWHQQIPVQVSRITITPDERFVIVAGSDGILRWFAVRDEKTGKTLDHVLSFYVNEPDHRWVVWTPGGYYDASDEHGEDLIGWHINRGPDRAPLFYSASRFRSLYYRPGVIRQVLKTGREPAAPNPKALLAQLPPIVRILGVRQSNDGTVHVQYVAQSPYDNRPVTGLRVMIDGVLQDLGNSNGANGARPKDVNIPGSLEEFSVKPSIASGLHALAVAPVGEHGRIGETVIVKRSFAGTNPAGANEKHELWALVIGVGHFKYPSLEDHPLIDADKDADAIGDILKAQEGKGRPYTKVHVKVLTNRPGPDQATHDAIRTQLELLSHAGKNDVTLLYLSGHGKDYPLYGNGENTGNYVFYAWDTNPQSLGATGLQDGEIVTFEKNVRARKIILLDTCYAGRAAANIMRGLAQVVADPDWGASVLASSAEDEQSWEFPGQSHSPFTQAVLAAFHGAPELQYNRTTGKFTPSDLIAYMTHNVDTFTRKKQTFDKMDMGQTFDMATVIPDH